MRITRALGIRNPSHQARQTVKRIQEEYLVRIKEHTALLRTIHFSTTLSLKTLPIAIGIKQTKVLTILMMCF